MKKTLFAATLATILFASCAKKQNIIPEVPQKPAPEDSTYIINGITDYTISSLDSEVVGLNIIYREGKQSRVTISVEGLPNKVVAKFNPASGFPGFNTAFSLASYAAKPGTYPITIKGTSDNGLVKTFKVNLTVKDDLICDSFILKQNAMFNTITAGNRVVHTGTHIDSVSSGNRLQLFLNDVYLDTVLGQKVLTGVHSKDEVNFFVDCENETINIPSQTIIVYTAMGPLKYIVSGIGSVNYRQRILSINYTVVTETNKTLNYTMTTKLTLW